ncbi:MAG: DUF2085 domain-containing protein [Actinomycetia bacterium]|nr:DUF2085 domain-containing protein [Actinomycetes bacterium]
MVADWLQRLMLALGAGVCHQLPERSFISGGFQQPVCSRCSGIYVATVAGLLVLFALYRRRRGAGSVLSGEAQVGGEGVARVRERAPSLTELQDKTVRPLSSSAVQHDREEVRGARSRTRATPLAPSPTELQDNTARPLSPPLALHWSYWVFLGLALIAMAADGLSSYAGIRPTNDTIRLITGLAVGGGLAPLLMALLSETLLSARARATMLARPRDWALYLAALILAGIVDYPLGRVLGPVTPLLVTLSLVVTFAVIVLVILGLFKHFEHSVDRPADLLVPGLSAILVALVLLMVLALLKAALFSWLVRG